MHTKIHEFLTRAENYKLRGAFVRVSSSDDRGPETMYDLTKRQIASGKLQDAVANAGSNPHFEICRKTGGGANRKTVSLARYKAVQLGDHVGIFID